ncbi:EAL domain-containing protein [Vibrio renipiscarius]|uniref:cyclic-guanylate-specific phosphodiesterase n=1 Tax=Vibrio renipiscarius TaxID=1461322 RepID=A0A0C2NQ63_9VIBR|nr:EAL domain-containing protein [Vibrio renipiscarius]KII76149.1 diguanylate cyclase [Vibrio renipiscarius]KII78330.1 diguanylate cyclase [Vibrio renipiscarius]
MYPVKFNFKKIYTLSKEMVSHFPNLMPVVVIFAFTFAVSILSNYYHTQKAAREDGLKLIHSIERHIGKTASELYILNDTVDPACSQQDKLTLRGHVFHSTFIKEVGIYQDGYVVCTSNEGNVHIPLPSSITQRIQHSQNHITIELDRSNSEQTTFFIYASIKNNYGLNALFPPQRLLNLMERSLKPKQYQYHLSILGRDLNGEPLAGKPVKEQFVFDSTIYPLQLTLSPTVGTYQFHYFSHIWQTILVASLFSIVYLIAGYQLLAKRSIEFNLLNAIEDDHIELYLQPIVDINTNSMVGSEALVRWNHPKQGQISPEIFIPLAEKLLVIDLLTKKILDSVAKFLNENPHYQTDKYISVNLSRVCLIDDKFVDYLQIFANRQPHLVNRILLEVTENLDFDQSQLQRALRHLDSIQRMGFELAVDDFGTGYSGLNFIRQHRFHVMKIDQVFIKSLHSDSSIMPVLVSMLQLARELNMKVIAEGVENEQQMTILKELGVSYIQGFYYSPPIKPEELLALGNDRYFEQLNKQPT